MATPQEEVKRTAQNVYETAKEEGSKVLDKGKKALGDLKSGVEEGESGEGTLTKQIEAFTTKVPSATFLGIALGAIGVSAVLQLMGKKENAQFVGQWVPTVLLLGLYNKLVKLEGSE